MKIFLNGRKVGKNCLAYYLENAAYFSKSGLKRRVVLHELYHHLVEKNQIELSILIEEREANTFSKIFIIS